MSYADERPGGIRPIVQSDIDDGIWFRGVTNFGADVSLSFLSVPSGGIQTVTIPSGATYGFTFKATSLPASTLHAYIDYSRQTA